MTDEPVAAELIGAVQALASFKVPLATDMFFFSEALPCVWRALRLNAHAGRCELTQVLARCVAVPLRRGATGKILKRALREQCDPALQKPASKL